MYQTPLAFDAPLSFDNFDAGSVLYVREASGSYRVALNSEVVAAARSAVDAMIPADLELMNHPQLVRDFLSAKLGGVGHEVFSVMYLNSQHHLISYIEMFRGTLNQTSVYPREIVKTALRLNAASILLCHCHPSGNPTPSAADMAVTRQIRSALELVDIRLLDHIIVGGNATLSMAEKGLMPV